MITPEDVQTSFRLSPSYPGSWEAEALLRVQSIVTVSELTNYDEIMERATGHARFTLWQHVYEGAQREVDEIISLLEDGKPHEAIDAARTLRVRLAYTHTPTEQD